MKTILLATRNCGKVKEIIGILNDLPLVFKTLSDFPDLLEVIEDGKTLEENALKKAKEVYNATGIPTISDDSGLEVFSLNYRPGVYSARYAGEKASYEENNKKLLDEMMNVPEISRGARFRCCAAFVDSTKKYLVEGVCYGRITNEPKGSNGFGYDPLFVPDGYTQTFAELSTEIKNQISHRAKAFLQIKKILHLFLENKWNT